MNEKRTKYHHEIKIIVDLCLYSRVTVWLSNRFDYSNNVTDVYFP